MIFVLIGAVSCFLMGVFLDKTKNYIVAIRYVTISTFTLMALTPFVIPIGKMWITCIFAFCAGLFIVPVLPATYQYASTQAGKIPPMVVTGLMMSGGQTWALILSLLFTYLLKIDQVYGLIGMTLFAIVPLVCSLLIRPTDLRASLASTTNFTASVVQES